MILGDQGAEVIKVEPPEGDSTRAGAKGRGGFNASFLNNNRNKRSIVLNLKHPAALAGAEAAGRDGATFLCRIIAPASPTGSASAKPRSAPSRPRSSMSRSAALAKWGPMPSGRSTTR